MKYKIGDVQVNGETKIVLTCILLFLYYAMGHRKNHSDQYIYLKHCNDVILLYSQVFISSNGLNCELSLPLAVHYFVFYDPIFL